MILTYATIAQSTTEALELLGLTAWAAQRSIENEDAGRPDDVAPPSLDEWLALPADERERWRLIAESVAETVLEDTAAWQRWLPRAEEP